MKKRSSRIKWVRVHADDLSPHTEADIARLKAAQARPIDTSDIPEATAEDFKSGKWGPAHRIPKVAVTLSLDADVAERVQAQTPARINQLLRRALRTTRTAKAG